MWTDQRVFQENALIHATKLSILSLIVILQMESLQMNKSDVQLMAKICFPQSNLSRRQKQIERICSTIVDKCQACQLIASKDKSLITICVYPNDGTKDAPECDADNIFACLLFALLRKRSINVQFITATKKLPTHRTNDNSIRMNVGKISSKQYKNTEFFKKVTTLLQNQRENLLKFHSHFKTVSFKYRTEEINSSTILSEVVSLSMSTLKFISRYLVQLTAFFPNDIIHIDRLAIDGFDNCADLEIKSELQWTLFEEMEMKSILKSVSQIFCRTFIVRVNRLSLLKYYSYQNVKKKENLQPESGDSDLQQRFEGNSLQYLEKLMVCFSIYDDKSVLLNLFPYLPNLSHFYIQKSKQVLQLGAQPLLKALTQYNKLLKLLTFKNIQTELIDSSVLMAMYQQCPFLSEIEGLGRFKFPFEETYISADPRQRDQKEQDRKCQLILRAMLLRNISFNMKTDIIKLMLHDGYDFNTALEVVQSVENVCF